MDNEFFLVYFIQIYVRLMKLVFPPLFRIGLMLCHYHV